METNNGGCGCNSNLKGGTMKVHVGPKGGKYVIKVCNGKKTKRYIKDI